MAYTPQIWSNGPEGGTPLSALRLQTLEDGLQIAANAADAAESPGGAQTKADAARDAAITSARADATTKANAARDAALAASVPNTALGVSVATLTGGLLTSTQVPDLRAIYVHLVNGALTLNGAVVPASAYTSALARQADVTAAIAAEAKARSDADALLVPLSQKGAINGVASLGADGKVPSAQLPASGALPAQTEKTATYTLGFVDASSFVKMNLPVDGKLLVPTDAQVNFPVGTEIRFAQLGAGQVSVASAVSTGTVAVRDGSKFVSNSGTATSFPIPMPVNVQAGDGLLVSIEIASLSVTITPPSDFVAVRGVIGPLGAGSHLFKKVNAPGTDAGATKTFTTSAGVPLVANVISLSGADTSDFIDGFRPLTPSTADDQGADPYVTVAEGCLEISVAAYSSGTTQNAAVSAAPTGMTLTPNGSVATTATDANSRVAMAVSNAGPVAAGTTIGNRAWASGYGSTSTIAVKPTSVTPVSLRSAGGALKTAGQYADAALTKIGPNEWLVTGFLTA